jgi:hypothetical protein
MGEEGEVCVGRRSQGISVFYVKSYTAEYAISRCRHYFHSLPGNKSSKRSPVNKSGKEIHQQIRKLKPLEEQRVILVVHSWHQ